ncbi:hypothetical protein [Treponema sp.]|uniref:hypothetical protein n=1 Tax=Treponema sp. TaxID=166 RepID=UPI00298E3778|nr:hypothetical protein [Treponema sp.]MCR5613951.1 hypothetical protein [Treponema sp.]
MQVYHAQKNICAIQFPEDDSGRLSYKWYRENPDNGNQEEIYGWTESYYEYDSSLDRNKILVSKTTLDGVEKKLIFA